MNDAFNKANWGESPLAPSRGTWQESVVLEMREGGYPLTKQGITDMINSYDAQLHDKVGEGSHAEGRANLRKAIRAAQSLSDRS